VEEIGRAKPRIVSELMEVANRFADGEDAYNNKIGRSLEVDRASRQRRRYRNGDSHARQNQVVIRLKRIYNFLCSMLVFTPFALCFVTLCGVLCDFRN
jgi:hypothetical protein